MITIRDDQLGRWHQNDPERFVDSVLSRVRDRHPTWRQTDVMMRDSIRAGIRRARRNGLETDRQISEFVLIMFEVAPNFDRQTDIRRALDDGSRPVGERWERLFTPEFDRAWAEADRPEFLDAGAWFDEPVPDLSHAVLLSFQDWAEVLARISIARQTQPGDIPREPTYDELRKAAEALYRDYITRTGPEKGR